MKSHFQMCIHEAGHAVIGSAIGFNPVTVSVNEDGGYVECNGNRFLGAWEEMLRASAGIVAEWVLVPDGVDGEHVPIASYKDLYDYWSSPYSNGAYYDYENFTEGLQAVDGYGSREDEYKIKDYVMDYWKKHRIPKKERPDSDGKIHWDYWASKATIEECEELVRIFSDRIIELANRLMVEGTISFNPVEAKALGYRDWLAETA